MTTNLSSFTDVLDDVPDLCDSPPLSLSFVGDSQHSNCNGGASTDSCMPSDISHYHQIKRPTKGTGQCGQFRSIEEIDEKYRSIFSYPFFNSVQSSVIEDALYSDKSMVVCAPTGSGKTVLFEMAIVRLLMELEDTHGNNDFKIIYMAPVKALCTERLTEWYAKFTKLGLLCIAVTGDTDVDFSQLKPYRIIITTPEKWDMVTRRWRDHRQLVEVIKLFLIDEVHILNDATRGPVLEAVVSRMKTIETSVQTTHRIEKLQQQYGTEGNAGETINNRSVSPNIRFVAVSATVSNPEDVATWLGTPEKPAVHYRFGDECRPVKLRRVVEGYPCAEGTSIFKFDITLNYKLWPIIQKYHNGKPTLIFCNTRKSVTLTAETLLKEIRINFNPEQEARLQALASTIKTKKLQMLVLSGIGCHHAGLLYEERTNIEQAFRNRDLPILITTTTLAMGVNLPAHLVIVKNTQQYVQGAYQEYSISTVLQMVGRAGRPQFDTEATAVIMTRLCDKPRYQALVGGSEPLQSNLHKRLPENLNSEVALGTVSDVAQCVQWLQSTFLCVRAAKDPKRYLGLPQAAPQHQISKKIEELCVKAMNGLVSSGLITMDEACCIESTEAGRLMSIFYLDLETMKHIMKIEGSESLERLLWIVCECHELADMHLRVDERRCLNLLNRNTASATIRYSMKGKITTRQMKLNCVIQAVLGCLTIPDPSLNQEATKIMRIAERVCKCLVKYIIRPALVSQQPKYFSAVLNAITLAKCVSANLWENSPFVSKQLKGIGPTYSTLLATAGKVNFMLLEESHPRDLERIMNKGPPAGNVLRKQISLLPKYQLTTTPVDERTVQIQVNLLNQNDLADHMEDLTAGASHNSYVIVGNSENDLLLLTSFTDKDLIRVYDGSITYRVTRKYGNEHKIFAHCVSSTFVGIDDQCEYVFQDIEPQMRQLPTEFIDEPIKRTARQTTITDTFKERKRKNTESHIAQSKEKKKRESAPIEKFNNLKESFGKTSQALKDDLNKSGAMSSNMAQGLCLVQNRNQSINTNIVTGQNHEGIGQIKSNFFEEPTTYELNETDFADEDFVDEENFNSIMNKLECEMKMSSNNEPPKTKFDSDKDYTETQKTTTINQPYTSAKSTYTHIKTYESTKDIKKQVNKNKSKKSNYDFLDLLERKASLTDEEKVPEKDRNTFSDTIRFNIEKYFQDVHTKVKVPDKISALIQSLHQENGKHATDYGNATAPINNNGIIFTDEESVFKQPAPNSDKSFRGVTCKQYSDVDHAFTKIDLEVNEDINTPSIASDTDYLRENIEHNSDDVSLENIPTMQELNRCIKQIENEDLDSMKLVDSIDCVAAETDVLIRPLSTLNTELDLGLALPTLSVKGAKNADAPCYYNRSYANRQLADKQNVGIKNCSTVCIPSSSVPENNGKHSTACSGSSRKDIAIPFTVTNTKHDHNLELENFPTKEQCQRTLTNEKRTENAVTTYKNPTLYRSPFVTASRYKFNNPLPNINLIKKSQLPQNKKILEPIHFSNRPLYQQHYCNNGENIGVSNILTNFKAKQQLREVVQPNNNNAERDVAASCFTTISQAIEHKPSYTQQRRLNYSDTNNRNHYINKYSYSSNKVSVSTNETDDHVVRVTRKLKFNLDVTEIISKTKKTSCTQRNEVKFDPVIRDFNKSQILGLPHSDENTKQGTYDSEIEEEFKNDENISDKPSSFALNTSTKPNLIITDVTQCENIKENNIEEKYDDEKIKTNEHKVKVDKPNKNKLNSVESVLQKYSSIMRNDTSRITDSSLSQTKGNDKIAGVAKKEKPNRPFKISDIHHLNTPLPDTIIDPSVYSLETYDKTAQIQQYVKHNLELISQMLSNPTQEEPEHRDVEVDGNLLEPYKNDSMSTFFEDIPYEGNQQLDETCTNIEYTMFNPKTLLQCIGKRSSPEIVPPPPEFCDNLEEKLDDDLSLSIDTMMENEKGTTFSEVEQSIFEDSNVELTPSKEIETWNLTEDESSNMFAPPGRSPFSFTIMRNNREHINRIDLNKNLSKNSYSPRNSKLKQYKFNNKNKYKL